MGKKQINRYDRFAEVYDRVGQSTPAEIMKNGYMQDILAYYDWHGKTILDLGCGTGTLAIWLAEQGYRVTGIDASRAMVEHARRKAAWAGQAGIEWKVQDARRLRLAKSQQYDLVIALNAVLSHLLEDNDLAAAFKSVGQIVKPGGLFLFELPTEYAMEHIWGYNRIAEVHDDLTWIWQHSWDPQTRCSTTDLTHFVQSPDQPTLYERFCETHIHRAYNQDEIEPLLAAAGLRLRDRIGFGTLDAPTHDSTEIIYVAEI